MLFSVAAGPWEAYRPRSLRALVPFPGGQTASVDRSLSRLDQASLAAPPQPDFERHL